MFVLAALVCMVSPANVAAHANLDELRSNPTPDSVNEVPPDKIRLWFTEPLDPDQSSIQVFDDSGRQVDEGDAKVDSGDPNQMIVSLESVSDGTYTVSWSALSTVDGHPSQGTYTFQVGQGRLPGAAATTGGDRPSINDVTLRWLTIGGLAIVAGWFLLHTLRVEISGTNRALVMGGAILTLMADLYLVADLTLNAQSDSGFSQIVRDMPLDWYVRVILEVALIGVIALILVRQGGRAPRLLGLGLTAAAVASLTWTTHAAAEPNQLLAMPVNALHLLSVAFWLGGLAHLALASVTSDEIDRTVLGRFSRFAMIAAPVALATGFINAGLLLPTVESAWTSAYGQSLILKLVLVGGALAFAWVNRKRVWAYLAHVRGLFRTLRTEAVFGVGAILIASVMALSALPTIHEDEPLHLRISVDEDRFAHLRIEDPDPDTDEISFWLSDRSGQPIETVDDVGVQLSMLDSDTDFELDAERQTDGRWLATDPSIDADGWWRARVDFAQESGTDSTEFVFMLPDPKLTGDEPERSTDDDAVQLFQSALGQLLELESMRTVENLGDGAGRGVRTEYAYSAPDRLQYQTSSGNQYIAVGADQYLLKDGEDEWLVRDRRQAFSFPDVFSFYYTGARDLSIGREVESDGRTYQLVSFYVPEVTGRAESWYLWYIDTQTGRLRREVMIADHHYMDNRFGDFNEAVTIERPVDADSAGQ